MQTRNAYMHTCDFVWFEHDKLLVFAPPLSEQAQKQSSTAWWRRRWLQTPNQQGTSISMVEGRSPSTQAAACCMGVECRGAANTRVGAQLRTSAWGRPTLKLARKCHSLAGELQAVSLPTFERFLQSSAKKSKDIGL
eukprot:1153702-Pelagomonas_calceolata.AAC.18